MDPDRGQTTIDFVIGISVFLAAIFFVFLFAPGILTPFTVSGQSDAITVDRTADYLSQDALGGPDEPYVLERACTVAFFNRSGDDPPGTSDCRYEDEPLREQLGLAETRTINVTITGNVSGGVTASQLYWDTEERELTAAPGGNKAVRLTIGDDIEQRRATTTATRVVTLNGKDVTMTVVVS